MDLRTKQGGIYNVLVVDDDSVNRELTCAVVRKMGMRADSADSGSKALKLCQYNFYNLILMDLEMPGMDGYAATRSIRKLQKNPVATTKIVALTGSLSGKAQVVQCLESGMNDCMVKPLKPEMLRARLVQWLQGKFPDTASGKNKSDLPTETEIKGENDGYNQ